MLTHGIDMPDGENIRTITFIGPRSGSQARPTSTQGRRGRRSGMSSCGSCATVRGPLAQSGRGRRRLPVAAGAVNPSALLSSGRGDGPGDRVRRCDRRPRSGRRAGAARRPAEQAGPAVLGRDIPGEPVLLELQPSTSSGCGCRAAAPATFTSSSPFANTDPGPGAAGHVVNQRGCRAASTVSQTLRTSATTTRPVTRR